MRRSAAAACRESNPAPPHTYADSHADLDPFDTAAIGLVSAAEHADDADNVGDTGAGPICGRVSKFGARLRTCYPHCEKQRRLEMDSHTLGQEHDHHPAKEQWPIYGCT